MKKDPEILEFTTDIEFEKWISTNFEIEEGIWLRMYKKASGIKSIYYKEALDVALCYGWIDGQVKKYDEKSYLQRFTPRRKKSNWSKRNTEHIERLTLLGKMKPSGIAEVERAKLDGRWEKAYASPANIIVPSDFQKALDKNKKAREFWDKLNKSNRYALVWQINDAKKEETRIRRIEKFITMLEKNEKLY